MAALHDEIMELGEELRPLTLELRPTGRRTKALVALGLGLAVAATYAVAQRGGTASVPRSSLQGLQGKDDVSAAQVPQTGMVEVPATAPVPVTRIVEGNLADFIDAASIPAEAHPGRLGASLGEASAMLFGHVVEKSSIDTELTPDELVAYKYRFVAAMLAMEDANEVARRNYVERAQEHIEGAKPVMTQALADSINSRETSYQVKMQRWMLEESMDSFNARLIKVPYEVAEASKSKQFAGSVPQEGLQSSSLPANFQSGEQWAKCKEIITNPHNQGRCGSCWVFGATGALDSRLCIATKGAFSGKNAELSRGFGASCAVTWDGCQGGWPHLVYDYIDQHAGVPSSNCIPYFAGTDYADHWNSAMPAPACPTTCDSRFPQSMSQDLFRPVGIASYKLVDQPDTAGIEQLKAAIYSEGPCPYAFYANREFMGYAGGVFSSGCGHQANHAVQAIGWGVDHGKQFIQSLNSWGTDWGVQGGFNVAYCVVWHFVIPGSISSSSFPLPIPDRT